jgi:transcriptional regulator with XRE-family HTH domain
MELGLSISEAARRAGVNQGEWSRYEAGTRDPRVYRLVWIADALDTVAANLVLGIDPGVLESRHPRKKAPAVTR